MSATRGEGRKRARLATKILAAALAVAGVLGALEILLHVAPSILPYSYRRTFPMHGVELFHPGLLDRVPIEGVPLPLVVEPRRGPPPADLKELGLAPREEASDVRRFPRIHIPADERGFPNPEVLDEADLVLIGDSFAVAAGVLEPQGLQGRLAAASGLRVYNLGVSALGPVRELWLLENVALGLNPRCVVWFFFSGNDVIGSARPLVEKRKGNETWGQLHADRRPPRLILPDLIRSVASSASSGPAGADPLPGFRYALADGSVQPLWFLPFHLQMLRLDRAQWEGNNGWKNARDVLARASQICGAAGVRFLVVYVPSKVEVYLPYVEADPDQLDRTMSWDYPEPRPDLQELLERRRSLEETVTAFCASSGIPFLSATGPLESMAARGELGYLVTDTHWQVDGQASLLPSLLAWLESEGILED